MGRRNRRHRGNRDDEEEDDQDSFHHRQYQSQNQKQPHIPTGPRFGQQSSRPNQQEGLVNPFLRQPFEYRNQIQPETQHQRHNQHDNHPPNHRSQNHTSPIPQYSHNHQTCHLKSQRIKRNLLLYLNNAFDELSAWDADLTSHLQPNQMDWQPESEIVIPQFDPIIYSYGPSPLTPLSSCLRFPALSPVPSLPRSESTESEEVDGDGLGVEPCEAGRIERTVGVIGGGETVPRGFGEGGGGAAFMCGGSGPDGGGNRFAS